MRLTWDLNQLFSAAVAVCGRGVPGGGDQVEDKLSGGVCSVGERGGREGGEGGREGVKLGNPCSHVVVRPPN